MADRGINMTYVNNPKHPTATPTPTPLRGRKKAVSLNILKSGDDFFIQQSIHEDEAINGPAAEKDVDVTTAMPIPPMTIPPSRCTTEPAHPELMGPILRRKKIVSMPYGDSLMVREFFKNEYAYGGGSPTPAGPRLNRTSVGTVQTPPPRARQTSDGSAVIRKRQSSAGAATSAAAARRRASSIVGMGGIMRRKQVSLDLLAPQRVEFFGPVDDHEVDDLLIGTNDLVHEEEKQDVFEETGFVDQGVELEPSELKVDEEGMVDNAESKEEKRLFLPLIFSEPKVPSGAGGHGSDGGGHRAPPQDRAPTPGPTLINEEAVIRTMEDQAAHTAKMKAQLENLRRKIESRQDLSHVDDGFAFNSLLELGDDLLRTHEVLERDHASLKANFTPRSGASPVDAWDGEVAAVEREGDRGWDETYDHSNIIRATKKDYYFTALLALIMAALTGIVLGWHTEVDTTHAVYGVVGLACVTPCEGDVLHQDFFHGKSKFGNGEVLQIGVYLDPSQTGGVGSVDSGVATSGSHRFLAKEEGADDAAAVTRAVESYLNITITNTEGTLKTNPIILGPADAHERKFFRARVDTSTFSNPNEEHVINVYSTNPRDVLSFTLSVAVLHPISMKSVLIAALIMIFVYAFILFELIHRTLIAIFGSMIALFIFFVMHHGHTEPIKAVMLHMDWSTLGLLFGMMMIVGELSHTGIFEYTSVRLLVSSKGSFKRLIVLLCSLTAVASAFLDNVTTMLLVAPVTIDMCRILDVDPRPYLIGEVILSNVGGTATLIGDPPNIIIGTAIEDIGFVDFIIYILPCIFLFCIPVSLIMVVLIYRDYLTASKMRVLNVPQLKAAYPIYDQPRLLIAGTVAAFVILLFFLHPLHHKDTAWIALVGAFITMAFTNPHDVQTALRNHIEWDTLLFFAGLFVLVEVCAAMGLLRYIGNLLAGFIASQPQENQLSIAITLILWVSAFTSAFLDNIPYTATMIPVIVILSEELPETLPLKTLAWALSFGACLGGNGTLLGASANIVTAGISTSKGFNISFLNFFYPGMLVMIVTVAISNLYMMVVHVWI